MARRAERVDALELRKAEFLTGYRALCQTHGMMVVQLHTDDPSAYAPFVVALTGQAPGALEKQMDEMLISDALWITWE